MGVTISPTSSRMSDLNTSVPNKLIDLETDQKLQDYIEAAETVKIVAPIVFGIVFLLGIFGNSFVIYVTMTTQRVIKHPIHSMLVLNLAVADLSYLAAVAPYQSIGNTVPGWIYGSLMCPLLHFLSIQTMAVSIFTMCSLALMRFLALMMPFKIQSSFITTSPRFAGSLIITIVWVLGSVLALPVCWNYRLKRRHGNEVAECEWVDASSVGKYQISVIVFTFLIPFFFTSVLYFFIGREVLCYMKDRNPAREMQDSSEYKKTTILVICLVVGFLICWLPHHLTAVLNMCGVFADLDLATTKIVLQVIGMCLSYAHACVNPIIYTFAAPGFRHCLYSLVVHRRCHNTECVCIKPIAKNKNVRIPLAVKVKNTSYGREVVHYEPTGTFRLTSPSKSSQENPQNKKLIKSSSSLSPPQQVNGFQDEK